MEENKVTDPNKLNIHESLHTGRPVKESEVYPKITIAQALKKAKNRATIFWKRF